MGVTTPTRSRKPTGPDAACVEAVDLAREAATEAAPGEVGEHLGADAEDERLVTHRFATTNPGYVGWHWAVTLTRASRAKEITIDEVVLLPGEAAVLAPPFVPWAERLRPGDLGPGDILPPPENDDRLVPGYTGEADAPFDPADGGAYAGEADLVADELGLGRARVLSPVGRADATDRWYSGERGPDAPIATAAPGQCATCGFMLAMAGSMGRVFGVCSNEYAPDDARVVSFDHGCGAHSEAVGSPGGLAERPPLMLDHIDYDLVVLDDVVEDVVEVAPAEVAEAVVEVEDVSFVEVDEDVSFVEVDEDVSFVEVDELPEAEGELLVEVVTEDEDEDFSSER